VHTGRLLAPVLLASCGVVLAETADDDVPPGCERRSSALDGGRCHCTSDCVSADDGGLCLDEATTGMPGGVCAHRCATSRDCGSGFECDAGYCFPRCTSGDECEPGRACTPTSTEGTATCTFLCDEPSDCESGRCNVYSTLCLGEGEEVAGGGLNAHCTEHDECRSGVCLDGACATRCDPMYQRCPDGGVCVLGLCLEACTMAADCTAPAICTDLGAESFCF
jgi:hypothetical protein